MATGRLPDPNTAPVTAKGDLYTYSTVPAKLAVGNNGETLVADSSASVGLRYQEPKAGNPVINSAFQVWQRGTSMTSASATYTADRWYASAATAGTVSRQVTGDTTNLPNIQYCARFARTAGSTSVSDLVLSQSFETINSIPFVGKTVTLSFYARKGANFSGASDQLKTFLVSGTGTDQNQISGYTGQATPINTNATLTTTWQRFSFTGTVATSATELAILFYYTPSGTAGAADYFEITGVQLEVGSVATPFKTQGVTLAGELAACQRYFQAVEAGASYGPFGMAFAFDTNTGMFIYHWKAKMRTNPTVTYSAAGDFATYDKDAAVTAVTTIAVERVNAEVLLGVFDVGGTPYSGGEAFAFLTNAGAAAKINASAEL